MKTTETGAAAERRAEKFLRSKKFKLLHRNFRARTGEIDLIMSQSDLLVFVEVRKRTNPNFGTGAESITAAKQRKIINTASLYLQKYGEQWKQYRFDVVSIGEDIHWIPNAFTLD